MRFLWTATVFTWTRWLRRHFLAENHVLKITIYPLQNADCFAVCPVFWVIDLTWCECSDFGVPSQGFEDLHRPFGQLSAIWPAILYATVVVRRAVSKQGLPTGLWTLSRLLIRAKVWNAPFILGSTQQGLSPSVRGWERYVYSGYMLCSRLVFSEYLCQVLQAGRSVLGLLSAVGEWLIHVYATSIHACLLPHTVITLYSPLCYCCCCLPCTQCSPSYTMYILLVYHHVLCLLLLNTVYLCAASHNAVVFASALILSAAYVITDQICKFRLPGL